MRRPRAVAWLWAGRDCGLGRCFSRIAAEQLPRPPAFRQASTVTDRTRSRRFGTTGGDRSARAAPADGRLQALAVARAVAASPPVLAQDRGLDAQEGKQRPHLGWARVQFLRQLVER